MSKRKRGSAFITGFSASGRCFATSESTEVNTAAGAGTKVHTMSESLFKALDDGPNVADNIAGHTTVFPTTASAKSFDPPETPSATTPEAKREDPRQGRGTSGGRLEQGRQMDGKGDILQDEVPLNDEGLIWGCDFSCGFESPSFEEVARHEETCKIEPGDAGVVENVRHAQFALLVSTSCREDQPGRKVRSTSYEAVRSPTPPLPLSLPDRLSITTLTGDAMALDDEETVILDTRGYRMKCQRQQPAARRGGDGGKEETETEDESEDFIGVAEEDSGAPESTALPLPSEGAGVSNQPARANVIAGAPIVVSGACKDPPPACANPAGYGCGNGCEGDDAVPSHFCNECSQ